MLVDLKYQIVHHTDITYYLLHMTYCLTVLSRIIRVLCLHTILYAPEWHTFVHAYRHVHNCCFIVQRTFFVAIVKSSSFAYYLYMHYIIRQKNVVNRILDGTEWIPTVLLALFIKIPIRDIYTSFMIEYIVLGNIIPRVNHHHLHLIDSLIETFSQTSQTWFWARDTMDIDFIDLLELDLGACYVKAPKCCSFKR